MNKNSVPVKYQGAHIVSFYRILLCFMLPIEFDVYLRDNMSECWIQDVQQTIDGKEEWCGEEKRMEQLVNQNCTDLTQGDTNPLSCNFHGISGWTHTVWYQGHIHPSPT